MSKRTGYTDEMLDLEATNRGLRAELAAAKAHAAEMRGLIEYVAPWTDHDYWAKYEHLRTPELVEALDGDKTAPVADGHRLEGGALVHGGGVPVVNSAPGDIEIAAANYEAQVELLGGIRRAFDASKRDLEWLALYLGVAESEARSWLDGEVDLRLSEIRYLANAVDARVAYRVKEDSK